MLPGVFKTNLSSVTKMVNIVKADIAFVNVGATLIEGLMLPDNSFGVAVPQIADLFLASRNTASRDLKRLMGEGFETSKVKTVFNQNSTNYVSLPVFEKIVAKLDRSGNIKAQDFRDLLIGLSLHQLFSDAFNIEFEKEQRNEWLSTRLEGKAVRKTLTEAIRDYVYIHNCNSEYRRFIFASTTDTINVGIFNRRAKELKKDWNCENPRDSMTKEELKEVEHVEQLTVRLMEQDGLEPVRAAIEALERLIIPVISR